MDWRIFKINWPPCIIAHYCDEKASIIYCTCTLPAPCSHFVALVTITTNLCKQQSATINNNKISKRVGVKQNGFSSLYSFFYTFLSILSTLVRYQGHFHGNQRTVCSVRKAIVSNKNSVFVGSHKRPSQGFLKSAHIWRVLIYGGCCRTLAFSILAQLEEVPRSESGLGAYLLDVDTEIAKRLGDDLWALCAGIVQRTEKGQPPRRCAARTGAVSRNVAQLRPHLGVLSRDNGDVQGTLCGANGAGMRAQLERLLWFQFLGWGFPTRS